MATRQTASMEDYLEAIAFVSRDKGEARVSHISRQLGVKMPSVSEAIRKLADDGLVTHERYGRVELTPEGATIAEDVIARHEMLRRFLTGILGVDAETAEKDGCKMEHSLSPETRYRLSRFVEFVLTSPGGKPEWLNSFDFYLKHGERPESCRLREEMRLPGQRESGNLGPCSLCSPSKRR